MEADMRFSRKLIFPLCVFAVTCPQLIAQDRNELSLSFGGGSLRTDPGGGSTAVLSLSYRFHVTRHISAEGALDFFNYKFHTGPPDSQSIYKDDYHGVEAAVVYSFLSNRETGRLLPFIVAGIGKTTTDFTEIPAHPYYRLGMGIAYHFDDRLGMRVEVRDEIITRLYQSGNPMGNLPSVRCGIVFRF